MANVTEPPWFLRQKCAGTASRIEYAISNFKLIGNSDINYEKTLNILLEVDFDSYLLIGRDAEDFKKAIEIIFDG